MCKIKLNPEYFWLIITGYGGVMWDLRPIKPVAVLCHEGPGGGYMVVHLRVAFRYCELRLSLYYGIQRALVRYRLNTKSHRCCHLIIVE